MTVTTPSVPHSGEFAEAAALYALGLLEGAELNAFEHHLADCALCQQTVEQDRRTLERLVLAAPELEASPTLKTRILERAAAEARLLAALRPARAPGPARSPFAWALAVAALLLVTFVGGLTLGQYWYARQELRAVTLVWTGSGVTPQGTARLVVHRSGEVVLVLDDLPPPPPGKLYQIWEIAPNQAPKPAGWLPTGDGSLRLGANVFGKQVAISIEDTPDPPQPSTPILVAPERL